MQSDIEKCFSQAAKTYDDYAEFQYYIAEKLVDMLTESPTHILDIGCGTGIVTYLIRQKFPNVWCTLLDISPSMLKIAKQKLGTEKTNYVCGSADNNELIKTIVTDYKVDKIVSNLCFQWLDNPEFYIDTYKKYASVTFSILLEKSFYQWYEAVKTVKPDFIPPVSLLRPQKNSLVLEYHTRYALGLDFLKAQKYLGTLGKRHSNLNVKQLKNAIIFFEKEYNSTISYYCNIII